MYRIKCSNGKYVQKTCYGDFITYTKGGKVFHNINLAKKNLYLCEDHNERFNEDLTYILEEI